MNNNINVAFDLVWKPKVEYNFCWTELDPAKLKLGLLLFKEEFRGRGGSSSGTSGLFKCFFFFFCKIILSLSQSSGEMFTLIYHHVIYRCSITSFLSCIT